MPIYQKYIARNILWPFLSISLVVIGIAWTHRLFKLSHLFSSGVAVADFLSVSVMLLPQVFFTISPYVCSLAVVYIYYLMNNSREILILQSSGLSYWDLAKPAFIFCLSTTLLSLSLACFVIGPSYAKLMERLDALKNRYLSLVVREQTFNKITRNIYLYIEKKDTNGFLTNLILIDRSAGEQLILAESGRIFACDDNKYKIEIINGLRQARNSNGEMENLRFARLFLQIELDSMMNFQSDNRFDFYSMSTWKLLKIQPNHLLDMTRIKEMRAVAHQRIIWPIYNLALPMLALSLFLRMKRFDRSGGDFFLIYIILLLACASGVYLTLQYLVASNDTLVLYCYLYTATLLAFYLLILLF
ncbi:LptF/LptG family permease [Rickettsiales endosymbiont of Paramecium tredecaurelia]|uniref:LptF/LptG family permease n=1 Tax=Candidatus Sarmatiella mevalonica TaxID=2770581 RepID=UPI00192137C5|nr:LptF/LptG family permease [Candidatus Sarmatiella mevalonica]MBL3284916.1 LptF/LptG family permease [Candidatus Sarmatiella mevalonica]